MGILKISDQQVALDHKCIVSSCKAGEPETQALSIQNWIASSSDSTRSLPREAECLSCTACLQSTRPELNLTYVVIANHRNKEYTLKKCGDLMSNYPTLCLPSDPVGKVAQILRREESGPVLIIEDEHSKKLAGIVTDHDLAVKVVAVGRDPNATRIADVMTRVVAKCRDDDDVLKAHTMMSELQLRRIPVVDREDRVLGILAHTDIAKHLNPPQLMPEGIRGMLPTTARFNME